MKITEENFEVLRLGDVVTIQNIGEAESYIYRIANTTNYTDQRVSLRSLKYFLCDESVIELVKITSQNRKIPETYERWVLLCREVLDGLPYVYGVYTSKEEALPRFRGFFPEKALALKKITFTEGDEE